MKYLFGTAALIFVASTGWHIGGRLSTDAIGMALGILFGIMAGIPAALIVLAAKKQDSNSEPQDRRYYEHRQQLYQQPPVIVVTGVATNNSQREWDIPGDLYMPQIPVSTRSVNQRQFQVVGEIDHGGLEW